jgi:hypothetical protein
VQLDLRGHPLHTRALSVVLAARADGRLDVRGSLTDLRKRGFVPVAGDLQTMGIVHHMLLDAIVDPATATLDAITAAQPAVAFEPSAATEHESCRDPIGRVAALAGTRLDADFPRQVSAAIGGPRGCSHLVTLAHLLASTAAAALAWDCERHGGAPPRPAGERVLRRDLTIDGHELASGRVDLAIQLQDLLFTPAPALAPPMERFGGQLEVRLLAEVDVINFTLTGVSGAERRRGLADLETAVWQPRDDVLAGLAGLRLTSGATAALLTRLGAAPGDRPLLDALLMLAPALIQVVAALSEGWAAAYKASPSVVAMGGLPDSCYMWRREGALTRRREAEGAPARRPAR